MFSLPEIDVLSQTLVGHPDAEGKPFGVRVSCTWMWHNLLFKRRRSRFLEEDLTHTAVIMQQTPCPGESMSCHQSLPDPNQVHF